MEGIPTIAFASRPLLCAKHNYSLVEKEALSVIYGIKKLYGQKFILETDHKPRTAIFGSKKGTSMMGAVRLQRWAIQLSAYNYQIKFHPSQEHANADGLSVSALDEGHLEGHYAEAGMCLSWPIYPSPPQN